MSQRYDCSDPMERTRGIAEAVTKIAGHPQHLDGAGRGDADSDGNIAFDVKLFSLCGVLWLGFEENLGCALSGCRCRPNRLRHRRRSVLSEVDGASHAAWCVVRASASGHTMRDARDIYRSSGFHVLSGG